ncbi:unnamed protein product [Allacma fusca]|uniref:Chromo domain-containing protein n=1 Tax=Allacma fusca TaxID=39272 RepID=A0A8J2LSJ5_9HEXA|nr:unnamed protein product [Allacma fusca]
MYVNAVPVKGAASYIWGTVRIHPTDAIFKQACAYLFGSRHWNNRVDQLCDMETKKRNRHGTKKYQPTENCYNSGDSSEGEEFVVEGILDKRFHRGRTEYLIKWFGWPSETNTWEPIKNLTTVQWMIERFEQKYSKGVNGVGNEACSDEVDGTHRRNEIIQQKELNDAKSGTLATNGYVGVTRMARELDLAKREEIESVREKDLYEGILDECPLGKTVAKIHGVTVVNGWLTFLVGWKSEDESVNLDENLGFDERNSNMVLALCMNTKFPQEVIQFYERHVNLVENHTPVEQERKSAYSSLQAAKVRHNKLRRELIQLLEEQEQGDFSDDASDAIGKEARNREKYNTHLSDCENHFNSDSGEDEFFDDIEV